MASFTTAGDTLELFVRDRGEVVSVAISGTYDQTILFQKERGSRGSGTWETLATFNTTNATEAFQVVTKGYNENYRLFLAVDGGGTAVVTLTDGDKEISVDKDRFENVFSTQTQALKVFETQVRMDGNTPITATADVTLTPETHAGRVVQLASAGGVAVTLPAATGTGHVYTVFATVAVTATDLYVVSVASASDTFGGGVILASDIAGVVMPTAATDDTITMNGSTKGGLIGSWVRFTDVASGKWMLEGALVASGAEETPFSNSVS